MVVRDEIALMGSSNVAAGALISNSTEAYASVPIQKRQDTTDSVRDARQLNNL
jgi:hypothetical protein